MAEPSSGPAVDLLLREARAQYQADRYDAAERAGRQAVAAAQAAGLRDREVDARYWLAVALRALGRHAAALTELTWVLGAVETYRAALEGADVAWSVAGSYMDWVACARNLPQIPVAQLFAVLDAGEAWLRRVGHSEWRSGLLHQRAELLIAQGEREAAEAPAREAIALSLRTPSAPGYTLATLRWSLGDLLRRLGRFDEAAALYQAVLDDGRSEDHGRKSAHEGLAYCALARCDAATALREARAAVQLGERMGPALLVEALTTLVDAARFAEDRTLARWAAERHLELARLIGTEVARLAALRDAADVALDEGRMTAARVFIAEAEPLAAAFDRQSGTTHDSDAFALRRLRLAAPPSDLAGADD